MMETKTESEENWCQHCGATIEKGKWPAECETCTGILATYVPPAHPFSPEEDEPFEKED